MRLVIIFGISASLLWIIIIPYNDANDEYLHYGLAEFIANQHRLPIFIKDDYVKTNCDRLKIYQFGKMKEIPVCHASYSIFPFPNYIISALFISPFPKDAPYRYIFARLPNLIYLITFLLLVWEIIKKIFYSESARQIAFVIFAFVPQITFINAYVNSDGFSLAVGAFVIYIWFEIIDKGLTRQNIILGSIALGLLASAKYNYFILFPATAVLFFFSFKRLGWKNILKFSGAAAVGIMIISGGWFLRNYLLYGDALGFATIKKTFSAIAPDMVSLKDLGFGFWSILLTTNWSIISFKSFFAAFGWMSIYLPNSFYQAMCFFIVISLFGWLFQIIDSISQKRILAFYKSKLFPLFAALLFAIIGSIGLSVWTCLNNDFQPQGRYLFPALIPIMIGIIKGLQYASRMTRINEKIILAAFAGWITVIWLFSHLMIIFYYEAIRNNPSILNGFFYYEKMVFAIGNNLLREFLLAGGTIIAAFLAWKIWKIILRNSKAS